jgi:hypothetical protein
MFLNNIHKRQIATWVESIIKYGEYLPRQTTYIFQYTNMLFKVIVNCSSLKKSWLSRNF